jgi:hypothetical protein
LSTVARRYVEAVISVDFAMDRTVFPTTHGTWLRTRVDDIDASAETRAAGRAARTEANAYVMQRYAGPLEIFVRGSSLARLGEPAELVHGFFASRLSDAEFLRGWARSDMRLRRWLMNGMLFYGQGVARDRARAAARGGAVEPRELDARAGVDARGESEFERAWALAVVREATARVEAKLLAEGRAVEFEIFRRHAIDGQPYAVFAREVGKSEQQCAGATRLVAQRVRAALAEVLREEGVPERELDDEISRVRAVL